jgi:hypothetical protein
MHRTSVKEGFDAQEAGMKKTIMATALLALVAVMSVIGPAAAHHKTKHDKGNVATTACGYTPETSDGADTHATDYAATYSYEYDTSDDSLGGLGLNGDDDNGWGTVQELSISTLAEDNSTSSPSCPDLVYRLVLFDSPANQGGTEVGRWELAGNGTTSLEFFPGDASFRFYDANSPDEACHYVEVVDPATGTLYDRTPDEGCATVPPEGSPGNSYR